MRIAWGELQRAGGPYLSPHQPKDVTSGYVVAGAPSNRGFGALRVWEDPQHSDDGDGY